MSTGTAVIAPLEPYFELRWFLDGTCRRGASRGIGLHVLLSESYAAVME